MTVSSAHTKALEQIRRNIEEAGCHIYVVTGGPTPRFAYTIGLRESLGAELLFAGGLLYERDDVLVIINELRAQRATAPTDLASEIVVPEVGSFTLRETHRSWTRALLLGALDYYEVADVDAYQIVPDAEHHTLDVPDTTTEWSATREPAWQWLHEPWQHPVSPTSTALTNLAALRGAPITEACRWEDDYWELFAGPSPDVDKRDLRLVPLGCLLGIDSSLEHVVGLGVDEGVIRETGTHPWSPWTPRG